MSSVCGYLHHLNNAAKSLFSFVMDLCSIAVMISMQVSQIAQKWPQLIHSVYGNPQGSFDHISTLEKATARSLVFITNERQLSKAQTSAAAVVLIPHRIPTQSLNKDKTWVLCFLPEFTMRTLKHEYFLATPYRAKLTGDRIHPSAVVDGIVGLIAEHQDH